MSTNSNWRGEWVPLELPDNLDVSGSKHIKTPSPNESTCPHCGKEVQSSFIICPKCGYDLQQGTKIVAPNYPVDLKPWSPQTGGTFMNLRIRKLQKYLVLFLAVGIILAILILIFGDTVMVLTQKLNQYALQVGVQAIGGGILSLLVGCVQAWIFRNQMARSRIQVFILASAIGGVIGGSTAGGMMDAGLLKGAFSVGALIGGLAGALSSLGQNLIMSSKKNQLSWLLYSLFSWLFIWGLGWTISWGITGPLGMATAAVFMMVSSGVTLSVFLYYVVVEF